jgi:hypothetical protein
VLVCVVERTDPVSKKNTRRRHTNQIKGQAGRTETGQRQTDSSPEQSREKALGRRAKMCLCTADQSRDPDSRERERDQTAERREREETKALSRAFV